MELEQARKRAEELRVVIERNNRLYYDQDAPELEDFEYDALTRELKHWRQNSLSWSLRILRPRKWAEHPAGALPR